MYNIYKITSNPTVDFAAEELKKYIRMMLIDSGEIPITYDAEANCGFRVGLMADFGLDMSDAADPELDDIVYIDVKDAGGIIAGSNAGAVLIAVYRYLRFCGCRWLFPGVDGEWIPELDTLPDVNYRKLADHRYRGQCNEGAEFQQSMLETIDFTPKIGMNTYMLEFDNPYYYYDVYYSHMNSTARPKEQVSRKTVMQWKRQCEVEIKKRGLRFHDMGHGWTAEPFGLDSSGGWQPSEDFELAPQTAEHIAMTDGERKLRFHAPLLTNVCMSNSKTRKTMASYIADYAQAHQNVDFLHIWLADEPNGHCECDKCRTKLTSDWYVMLLNDIDTELTIRGLDTHLVFIAYLDTFWAPIEEKIKNSKRFAMLYAPITRLYTETYAKKEDMNAMVPYERNNINNPRGMSECLAYLHDWKNKMWTGDCFCYEYHFMDFQYWDITNLFMSRILYDDIRALKSHGLSGMIEDGSQRSFFPTGFQYYVYGETLFDSSVSFDDLKEDYFSHAFGKNYKDVVAYLEKLSSLMRYSYFHGLESCDESRGKFYNPDMAQNAAEANRLVNNFKETVAANLSQSQRASQVAWQLLELSLAVADALTNMTQHLATGNEKNAAKIINELIDEMSKKEIYFERYYDHYLFTRTIKKYIGDRELVDNLWYY